MATTIPPVAVAPRAQKGKRKHSLWLWLIGFVVVVALAFAGYTAATLAIAYSSGQRTGYVQKLSRKGWICKTYEGELAMSYAPGLAPTIWDFSVRDDAVATKVNEALGKKVVLHYSEHRGVPTDCFGETGYYVDGVRIVE